MLPVGEPDWERLGSDKERSSISLHAYHRVGKADARQNYPNLSVARITHQIALAHLTLTLALNTITVQQLEPLSLMFNISVLCLIMNSLVHVPVGVLSMQLRCSVRSSTGSWGSSLETRCHRAFRDRTHQESKGTHRWTVIVCTPRAGKKEDMPHSQSGTRGSCSR